MNMLLAIIVDAYVDVKKNSAGEDDVLSDLGKQGHTSFKAMAKPKGVYSNAEVLQVRGKITTPFVSCGGVAF